jgi:UDP-N-acetylmuramoylalanine--D-glutamate ligase
MMDIAAKRVLIIGLGATGRSVARFLADRGAKLLLCDKQQSITREGLPPHSEVHLGEEDPAWLEDVDLLVPSPGVPRDNPLIRRAAALGIPILSELELASRFIQAPIVAVTGTNGKSTVTTMIGEILEHSGHRPFVGGNLGTPLIEAVDAGDDIVVAEVSSFQLEWVDEFRPHIGVHLKLTDDHLYRYRDLAEYGGFKARLFSRQGPQDFAVLNRDDPNVWQLASQVRSRVLSFGHSDATGTPAVWLQGATMFFEIDARRGRIDLGVLKLPGRHNQSNAMAATAAALALGAGPGAIEASLKECRGLPHRIEFVRERDGVRFFDDSKGTNVGSVLEALDAVTAPVILIAGGLDKGGDYRPLRQPLSSKVKLAILMGQARSKMLDALKGATHIESVDNLKDAVAIANRAAKAGDTVLLSPACSSFDQFENYAERGRIYQELVRAL